MNIGIVKWFDSEKGFGVISIIQNNFELNNSEMKINEVFLHIKNWKDNTSVNENDVVLFYIAYERNKVTAKNARYVKYEDDDFNILFQNDRILEIKNKVTRKFNILKRGLEKISFDNKSKEFLENYILNIFDSYSDDKILEKFSTLFEIIRENQSKELVTVLENLITKYSDRAYKLKFCAYKKDLLSKKSLTYLDIKENISLITSEDYSNLEIYNHSDLTNKLLKTSTDNILRATILISSDNPNHDFGLDGNDLENILVSLKSNITCEIRNILLKKIIYFVSIKILNFDTQKIISYFKSILTIDSSLDLSFEVIISFIENYFYQKRILVENELFKILLENMVNIKDKIEIKNFLNVCKGRHILDIKYSGIIKKEKFISKNEQEKEFFRIEQFFKNDDYLKRKFSESKLMKYNENDCYWATPIRLESELKKFANENKLQFIDNREDPDVNIKKNSVLLKQIEIPEGIVFCSGIKSESLDNKADKCFWWCNREPCFVTMNNLSKNWEDYTLFDFLNILGLDISEHDYIKFVSILNRFERLREKMYCSECENIMYPTDISITTKYAITKMCCENKSCKKYNEIVYLNDCLNGKCSEIIDSRESKKCPNGWYICNKCGSCCSHSVSERKLNLWEKTNKVIPQALIDSVKQKIGHLEKAEYYCYKCGSMMIEYGNDNYKCIDCNIEYNTEKYKLSTKRVHINLRRQDYPSMKNNIINELKNIILKERIDLEEQRLSPRQVFGILFNKEIKLNNGEIVVLKSLNNKSLNEEVLPQLY